MNENDLVELEIEEQGATVRLKKESRSGGGYLTALPAGQATPIALTPVSAPAAPQPAHGAGVPTGPVGPPPGTKEIRSPIVGTFYRSASPEAPSYVNVGDRVKPESVVCIVEAMKVMNEIKAEAAGEILEILVENGQAVEFDQPLFRLKSEG
jgi:acetyl-CoA carboxylase biotin carboxyl carrier protein